MANASPFRVSRHLTAGKDEKEGRMDQGFPPVNPHWLPVVTACGDILHDYPSHQFQGFSKSAEAPLWDSLHLFNNLDLNGETLPPSASPRADPKHRVTSCSLSDNTPLAAAPAVATGPSLSTGGAVGQPAPATGQKRFKCPISSCPNTFDRLDRAEACQNRHLGRAPHACRGACGNQTCKARYISFEGLRRHIRPLDKRTISCSTCQRQILKQNFSRHRTFCLGKQRSEQAAESV